MSCNGQNDVSNSDRVKDGNISQSQTELKLDFAIHIHWFEAYQRHGCQTLKIFNKKDLV